MDERTMVLKQLGFSDQLIQQIENADNSDPSQIISEVTFQEVVNSVGQDPNELSVSTAANPFLIE